MTVSHFTYFNWHFHISLISIDSVLISRCSVTFHMTVSHLVYKCLPHELLIIRFFMFRLHVPTPCSDFMFRLQVPTSCSDFMFHLHIPILRVLHLKKKFFIKPYVPREPRRDSSNRRLCARRICRICIRYLTLPGLELTTCIVSSARRFHLVTVTMMPPRSSFIHFHSSCFQEETQAPSFSKCLSR